MPTHHPFQAMAAVVFCRAEACLLPSCNVICCTSYR